MAEPPLETGAVQVKATEALPEVPDTLVGTAVAVVGVTEPDAEEAALVPTALVAVTVKV